MLNSYKGLHAHVICFIDLPCEVSVWYEPVMRFYWGNSGRVTIWRTLNAAHWGCTIHCNVTPPNLAVTPISHPQVGESLSLLRKDGFWRILHHRNILNGSIYHLAWLEYGLFGPMYPFPCNHTEIPAKYHIETSSSIRPPTTHIGDYFKWDKVFREHIKTFPCDEIFFFETLSIRNEAHVVSFPCLLDRYKDSKLTEMLPDSIQLFYSTKSNWRSALMKSWKVHNAHLSKKIFAQLGIPSQHQNSNIFT